MDRRSSTAKPEQLMVSPVKSSTRRNSLALPNSSTSSSRWNYLRASTGSCHDFCKYGKDQSFDLKSRDPLQRRIVSRPPDNHILMKSAIFPERTKKSPTLRPNSSSGSESLNFDGSSGIRKEIGSKPDRRKSLLSGSSAQKPKSSSAGTVLLNNPRKPLKEDTPLTKKVLPQLKDRRLSGSPNLPVKSISGPPRLLSSSANSFSLNPKRGNDYLKAREGKGRVGASVNLQKNVLPRFSVGKQKPLKPNKVDAKNKADVLDETLCVRDVETEPPVTEPAVPDRNEKGSERCVSPETPVSLCLSNSPALSFQEEDQMENENGLSTAMSSSQMKCSVLSSEEEYEVEISESEDSYSVSDYEEVPSIEGDRQTWAARNRAIFPEGLESKPTKLRFRRGKIVNLQSDIDTAPRRLKFRRGRTLEESKDINATASTRKKSSNRREAEGAGDSPDPSEKVVLKHHDDVREKKDGQASLLNNVIEETASKLVETRKSKVKALVGAFETVISLHDTKPSASS